MSRELRAMLLFFSSLFVLTLTTITVAKMGTVNGIVIGVMGIFCLGVVGSTTERR